MIEILRRVVQGLLRVTLLIAGVIVGAFVLLFATVLGAGLLLWTLATGRKPVMRFGMSPRATMAGMHARARPARPAAVPAEVIDIEAREVIEPRR